MINLIGMKFFYPLLAQLHLFVLLDFIKKLKWVVVAPGLETSNPIFLLLQTLGYSHNIIQSHNNVFAGLIIFYIIFHIQTECEEYST